MNVAIRNVTDAPIDSLILRIYEAALTPATWNDVVGSVIQAVGGEVGTLFFHDASHPGAELGIVAVCGYDQAAQAAYQAHFAALDVRMAPLTGLPPGGVYADDRTVQFRDIERSEIHNDFYRPRSLGHGMGVHLFSDGARCGLFSTHRALDAGGFDAHPIAIVERLAPHIMRALQIQRQMALAALAAAGFSTSLDHFKTAVFVTDETGRVLALNGLANILIGKPDSALSYKNGRLTAQFSTDAARLYEAIAIAARPNLNLPAPALRIARGSPFETTIVTAPLHQPATLNILGQAVLVFASETSRGVQIDRAVLSVLFDLSPAEADIAARLAAGADLSEVARDRGSSRETVRAQLKRLFAKTNTSTQAELVSLAMRSLAILDRS